MISVVVWTAFAATYHDIVQYIPTRDSRHELVRADCDMYICNHVGEHSRLGRAAGPLQHVYDLMYSVMYMSAQSHMQYCRSRGQEQTVSKYPELRILGLVVVFVFCFCF